MKDNRLRPVFIHILNAIIIAILLSIANMIMFAFDDVDLYRVLFTNETSRTIIYGIQSFIALIVYFAVSYTLIKKLKWKDLKMGLIILISVNTGLYLFFLSYDWINQPIFIDLYFLISITNMLFNFSIYPLFNFASEVIKVTNSELLLYMLSFIPAILILLAYLWRILQSQKFKFYPIVLEKNKETKNKSEKTNKLLTRTQIDELLGVDNSKRIMTGEENEKLRKAISEFAIKNDLDEEDISEEDFINILKEQKLEDIEFEPKRK